MTLGIPDPQPIPEEDVNRKRVRFRFKRARRKGSWAWKDLTKQEKAFTIKKLHYLSKQRLCDFRTGACRPRKWSKELPSPPDDLSEDVSDMLADYFDIDNKIRVFGYLFGREFHVIWFSRAHKHSK